jgi:uncharacterized membrane-anchored protein YhcB (DUF1043 family)
MAYSRVTWSHPRVLGILLLVFLAGIGTGALAMKMTARRAAIGRSMIGNLDKKAALDQFKKDLDLSPTQVEKIEIILDDFMKYVHDLQNQMDETRRYGREKIITILNEDQRKKFEKTVAELQRRGVIR